MTMKIDANDTFKVKTQKNLIFHAKIGQDKPKPRLANKPKTRSQTKNRKQTEQTQNSETNPMWANNLKT